MIQRVKVHSEERGLHLNVSKTKIMVVDENRTNFSAFMIGGEQIAEVEDFVYLGSSINTWASSAPEIRRQG